MILTLNSGQRIYVPDERVAYIVETHNSLNQPDGAEVFVDDGSAEGSHFRVKDKFLFGQTGVRQQLASSPDFTPPRPK